MAKVVGLAEAVSELIPDGASVALGCALEGSIPFAVGHELIRQRRRRLTLIGPISDSLFDQLIGAGCVSRVIAAWVGNVSEGLGHCYRRAQEGRSGSPIELQDHSNLSISLGLTAAAWGVPALPTTSLLGSDILASNPLLRRTRSALDGTQIVLVPAIKPEVTVVHAQRCDGDGNFHIWGALGVTEEAALAADKVLVTTEELVDSQVVLSDPNRILVPQRKVAAVVHLPGAAHPSGVPGLHKRDNDFYRQYALASRTEAGFERWLQQWVEPGWDAYLAKLGRPRREALAIRHPKPSVPVDYGYE